MREVEPRRQVAEVLSRFDLARSIDPKIGRVRKWVECARPDQGSRASPKCLPKAKAKALTPAQRLAAVRRKRKAERKSPKKKGRKPTMVRTLNPSGELKAGLATALAKRNKTWDSEGYTERANDAMVQREVQELMTHHGHKLLDHGMSRWVYRTPKGTALKVDIGAHDYNWSYPPGYQNEVEWECVSGLEGNPLVPKLVNRAPDYTWIEVELLRGLGGQRFKRAFKKATGMDFSVVRDALKKDEVEAFADSSPFFASLLEIIEHCELDPYDLAFPVQWGFDAEGQPKVLDLGMRRSDVG